MLNKNKSNNNISNIIPLSINTYFGPKMQFHSHNCCWWYSENLESGSFARRMISPSYICVNIKQNFKFFK
jgi:hypothetical protein